MDRLWIVTASRRDQVGFQRHTRLGVSLGRVLAADPRTAVFLIAQNTDGLPRVYNHALDQAGDGDVLALVHDDVYLDDYFLAARLADAHQAFDVVGVAGAVRADARHVGWGMWRPDAGGPIECYDPADLSGAVAHATRLGESVNRYGPAPRACALLDGCFLRVAVGAVRRAGVRFDERFPFHFYDLDFCRAARAAGLRVGTWPVALTHGSGGRYETPEWEAGLRAYREKWSGAPDPA